MLYSAIMSIWRHSEPTSALVLFKSLALLLLALKSAVNFIVYCWFSEKFRVTLDRVFHCQTVRRRLCYCCVSETTNIDANYQSVAMQTIAVHIGND